MPGRSIFTILVQEVRNRNVTTDITKTAKVNQTAFYALTGFFVTKIITIQQPHHVQLDHTVLAAERHPVLREHLMILLDRVKRPTVPHVFLALHAIPRAYQIKVK